MQLTLHRAGTALFLFDRHFGRLNYRKNGVALFEIHSLHEPVVMIDVTVPAAVRMTTSDTTLSETIFSIVPGKRFRMLVLMVIVTAVHGCSMLWFVASPPRRILHVGNDQKSLGRGGVVVACEHLNGPIA